MRCLAFPLPFPCVFRKFEAGERFEPEIGGGERRSLASYGTLTDEHTFLSYDDLYYVTRTGKRRKTLAAPSD